MAFLSKIHSVINVSLSTVNLSKKKTKIKLYLKWNNLKYSRRECYSILLGSKVLLQFSKGHNDNTVDVRQKCCLLKLPSCVGRGWHCQEQRAKNSIDLGKTGSRQFLAFSWLCEADTGWKSLSVWFWITFTWFPLGVWEFHWNVSPFKLWVL